MAIDLQKYTQELMDAAGISDAEQKKQLETLFFSNPKVKEKLTNTLSDIEAHKGRFEAEKKRADELKAVSDQTYQENLKIFNQNKQIVDEALGKVKKYEETYGELTAGERKQMVQDVIDKKTFDEELNKRDQLTIRLLADVSTITAKHLKDFNEVPDLEAIKKIALEQGMTAMKAYEEWAKPKIEERKKTEYDAALKREREEGFREGATKRAAGMLTDAEQKSPFMENLRKSNQATSTARESFLSGWREPVGAKQ